MMNRHQRWLWLSIILLAFGLRTFRLDGQSLWYDEGTSVALAGRSLGTITRSAAADIHPPFYYYLLHVWTRVAGFSPTAVRMLSAFTGTLLVALVLALGRQLFGPTVGLTAAFLAAISPFQVYYSQETRMYILVTALGTLSTWLGMRYWILAIRPPTPHLQSPISNLPSLISNLQHRLLWLAYVLTSALVLYTHYFGFSVLLAQNLAVGLWVLGDWRRRRSRVAQWAAAQMAVAVLYLPWLLLTWRQLRSWPAVSEPFRLTFLLRDAMRVFSLGLSVEPAWTPALVPFGVFLALGVMSILHNSRLMGHRRSSGWQRMALPRLMTVCYLFVPLLVMYVLSLRRPLYNPKFLLLATPAFHLLLALGLVYASRTTHHMAHHSRLTVVFTGIFLAMLLVPAARSLHNYFFDPQYARDDYRGIARLITVTAHPHDAVVLNAPSQIEIFDYYYHGSLSRYPIPRQRPPDAEAVRSELQQILDTHDRVYGIFWATDESDPDGIVETWLNDHAYKAMDAWYGNLRLVLYEVPPGDDEGTMETVAALLGRGIMLHQVTLMGRTVEAGKILPLALHWQAKAPIEARYKVFVQLLSPSNQIIAQRDAEPGGGRMPTTLWDPATPVIDRYGLWVPPGTPPAAYRLIVGMYSLDTGHRLPVTRRDKPAGDFVDLGTVHVIAPKAPPPVEALGLSRRVDRDLGAVRLLGYTLDKRGAEGRSDVPFYPGDTLRITLFWQAQTTPGSDLVLDLSLWRHGESRAQVVARPTDGLYPADRWNAGEIIRDAHDFLLPADLTPGRYRLRLSVAQADGRAVGPALEVPISVHTQSR